MKNFLYLIILISVANISAAYEDYWIEQVPSYNVKPGIHDHVQHDHNSEHIRGDYRLENKRYDNYYDHIERPCSTHDVDCIRHFLVQNLGCSPTVQKKPHDLEGPASDTFIVKHLMMSVPFANVSFTFTNARIRGLNAGRIEEFHFDKKTDTLVLEVTFDHLILDSPLSTITYYRKGKAPIEGSDRSLAVINKLSFTWTLRYMHDAHRVTSRVYAYLGDPNTTSVSGPGLETSDFKAVNLLWRDQISLAVKEAMEAQAPVYMNAFLETKICKLPYNILTSGCNNK